MPKIGKSPVSDQDLSDAAIGLERTLRELRGRRRAVDFERLRLKLVDEGGSAGGAEAGATVLWNTYEDVAFDTLVMRGRAVRR